MRQLTALLLTSTLLPSSFLLLPFPAPLLSQQPPTALTGTLDSSSPTQEDGSYYNPHTFEGKAGDAIVIDMESQAVDSYLILLDPNDKKIGENDDGGDGTNARIVITLPTTGTYRILANTAYPKEQGSYRITFRPATANDFALAEASQLNRQASELYQQGNYKEAEPLLNQALAIRERILGANHLDTAISLNNLAELYRSHGRTSEAEPLYQRALAITETQLGANHPDTALSLNNLALSYHEQGRYREAEPLYKRALSIYESQLGSDHPATALSLNNLALLYHSQGRYGEVEPLLKRALAIYEKALGDEHPTVATSLMSLSVMYHSQGRYGEVEPLLRRALAIYEKALGDEHPTVAKSLSNLAALYHSQGRYSEAEPLLKRALAIQERILEPEHLDIAITLIRLALLYAEQDNYQNAESLLKRALAIQEKVLGVEHPDVAITLNRLAGLYEKQNDYQQAEPLYQRALAIQEKVLGADHPDIADSLISLANLYTSLGNYRQAEPLYQRALAIQEKILGADHLDVARSLSSLAGLYAKQGNGQAIPLLKRALAIQEKVLGTEHYDVASSLGRLGTLYLDEGNLQQAEPLLKRALAIQEKVLGVENSQAISIQNSLSVLYMIQGDYQRAETLLLHALAVRKKVLGTRHSSVAESLNNLASLYQRQGKLEKTISLMHQAMEVEEHNLALILATGSEQQKQDYMNTVLINWTYKVISFHLQGAPTDSDAAGLALTTILRRKGRILDMLSQSLQAIRQSLDPQDKKLLEDLTAVRSQLSTLVYRGLGDTDPTVYRQQLQTLEAKSTQLEAALNNRSASFRQVSQPVTIEAVQRLIPRDAALVEFVVYQPFHRIPARRPPGMTQEMTVLGNSRYAVYVLRATGEPQWVDLGEVAVIDQAVEEFRNALQREDWSVDRIQAPGRKLDELLMAPVRKLAGNATTLLISPDGQLNLMPFAALVDEQNRYLVETTTIAYLSSGRDLLRFQEPIASQQPPVILVNPNYDQPGDSQVALVPRGAGTLPAGSGKPASSRTLSADMVTLGFAALDTSPNAPSMVPNLPGAVVLTQRQATKQVVLGLRSPSLLHVHTHGFFLPDQPREQLAPGLNASEQRPAHAQAENPLLRSGLALAGANLSKTGKADGILTAFEVTGLNLFGTKLVVLSACETGLGDIANGEGVYGLRRAFVLAGAESLLMSLWRVDDGTTRRLMTAYYENLQKGMGRAEALRQVQLQMLQARENDFKPYYWAAFVPSGNWAPMGL